MFSKANQQVENHIRHKRAVMVYHARKRLLYSHHSTCCPRFQITAPDPKALLKRPHRGNVVIWIQIGVVICGILNSLRWRARKKYLELFLVCVCWCRWEENISEEDLVFQMQRIIMIIMKEKFASWHFRVNIFTGIQRCVFRLVWEILSPNRLIINRCTSLSSWSMTRSSQDSLGSKTQSLYLTGSN